MKHPALSIHSFCLYPAFILLVITLCLNSSFVSKSFAEGLVLWYNNLVPLLLPFLLISGFFLSMIDWEHPNRAGCPVILMRSVLRLPGRCNRYRQALQKSSYIKRFRPCHYAPLQQHQPYVSDGICL